MHTRHAEGAPWQGRPFENPAPATTTEQRKDTENTGDFQHVSSPMSRVLFGIAVKMVQRQHGVSAAHAAVIVELSKMAEI